MISLLTDNMSQTWPYNLPDHSPYFALPCVHSSLLLDPDTCWAYSTLSFCCIFSCARNALSPGSHLTNFLTSLKYNMWSSSLSQWDSPPLFNIATNPASNLFLPLYSWFYLSHSGFSIALTTFHKIMSYINFLFCLLNVSFFRARAFDFLVH